MPYAKKNKTQFRRKRRTTTRPSSSRMLVVSRSLRSGAYLPESMLTTVQTSLTFHIPIGRATAAAGNYFNCCVNSISSPFAAGAYPITLTPGVTFAFYGNMTQGNNVSVSPMGLDQLIGLYQYYQVLSYRFEITAISTTVTDAFTLTAFPLGAEQAPSSLSSFMNTHVLQAQPNAKSIICASGVAANSSQQIVISNPVHKDLGMSKTQYTSEMWVTSAAPSNTAFRDFLGVFVQSINGSNNVAPLMFSVKLIQQVKLLDLISPIV